MTVSDVKRLKKRKRFVLLCFVSLCFVLFCEMKKSIAVVISTTEVHRIKLVSFSQYRTAYLTLVFPHFVYYSFSALTSFCLNLNFNKASASDHMYILIRCALSDTAFLYLFRFFGYFRDLDLRWATKRL